MMVFSGLLKSSSHATPPRRRRGSTHGASTSPEDVENAPPTVSPAHDTSGMLYLREQGQLVPVESDPDLRDLNNSLNALAAIFPDVQVEVFREILHSFEGESRLALATENLLKHKMKWVRGRYRVISKDQDRTQNKIGILEHEGDVPAEEQFRTARYQKAVKFVTYHEFKGLSRSTINAVLAEFNHSYNLARPTLTALSSKSWRFSLSSLFTRRKPVVSLEAEHHPLVVWQSTGQGSIVPSLKTTGDPELDRELFEFLIRPLQKKALAEREEMDHSLALSINNKEAEESECMHDCECCFSLYAFEELSACNDGGHFICFQCVRHAVNEAVFGQGWRRNIDLRSGTLRCVAAISDECKGCVPQDLVRRALLEEKGGQEILQKFSERLAEDNLLKTNLALIRCPFCSYAEVDELYLPEPHRSWRFKRARTSSLFTLVLFVLGVGTIPILLPLFLVFSFVFSPISYQHTPADYVVAQLDASVTRLRRKQLGLKFICQNERCGRASCISCSKAWSDIHICHESSLLALRTQVELAMSLAIKRTCPRCNTSFVKSSGCNKLTCVCGYQMCYVCRKDIGNGEGYRHFCEHFRPNGGRGCTECKACDLYRCEDDEVAVKKAKEEAERQWMEKEGTSLGGNEKVRKDLEHKFNKGRDLSWWEDNWWDWKVPSWERILDSLVECVID